MAPPILAAWADLTGAKLPMFVVDDAAPSRRTGTAFFFDKTSEFDAGCDAIEALENEHARTAR